MQTEIAGLKISYKSAGELKEKAEKLLDQVNKKLAEVEKERAELLKQQRALRKFLGIAPERAEKVLSEPSASTGT